MRYLAICCFVMLGIALAHAIPTHKFQGIRSLARTKSLVDRLRNLKAKTSRQLHNVRHATGPTSGGMGHDSSSETQTHDSSSGAHSSGTPACSDECGFNSLWLVPEAEYEAQLDATFTCVDDALFEMEMAFQADYAKETGEPLFTEEEGNVIWYVRMADIDINIIAMIENVWDSVAVHRTTEAGVLLNQERADRYHCLRSEVYEFFMFWETYEKK